VTTGWVASASHSFTSDTQPACAIDDDPTTSWVSGASQGPGMWFMIDMRRPEFFFEVDVVTWMDSEDYARKLSLSMSKDGETFTEIRSQITGDYKIKIAFNQAHLARYLKLEILEPAAGLWWRVANVGVRR
jgi:hypothetical protein